MPAAREVAAELRLIADALEVNPEAEIPTIYLSWYFSHESKQQFLDLVRMFPRPLIKEYEEAEYGDLKIIRKNEAIYSCIRIPRKSVCEIIEPARPAVFKCEALFSDDEVSEITR